MLQPRERRRLRRDQVVPHEAQRQPRRQRQQQEDAEQQQVGQRRRRSRPSSAGAGAAGKRRATPPGGSNAREVAPGVGRVGQTQRVARARRGQFCCFASWWSSSRVASLVVKRRSSSGDIPLPRRLDAFLGRRQRRRRRCVAAQNLLHRQIELRSPTRRRNPPAASRRRRGSAARRRTGPVILRKAQACRAGSAAPAPARPVAQLQAVVRQEPQEPLGRLQLFAPARSGRRHSVCESIHVAGCVPSVGSGAAPKSRSPCRCKLRQDEDALEDHAQSTLAEADEAVQRLRRRGQARLDDAVAGEGPSPSTSAGLVSGVRRAVGGEHLARRTGTSAPCNPAASR